MQKVHIGLWKEFEEQQGFPREVIMDQSVISIAQTPNNSNDVQLTN